MTPSVVDAADNPQPAAQAEEQPAEPGPSVTLNRADQIAAVFWLAFGALILLNGRHLGYLADFGPGPGFLPFWIGLGIILLGVGLFAKPFFRPSEELVDLPRRGPLVQMLVVTASLVAFAFLAERLGFILCIFALFLFLLFVVERRGILMSLGTAAAAGVLFWWLFEYMLQMRLPPGLLGLMQ